MERKLNNRIEEELENQFPKGDSARGRALVLHAIAQIEYQELQKAFDIALEENNRLRDKIKRVNELVKELSLFKRRSTEHVKIK